MGFLRAEEVTLPMRFVVMTAHFIAVMTVMFDLDALTRQLLLSEGTGADVPSGVAFAGARKQLHGLGAASLACFAIEYLGLFGGVSIFLRGHTCLYILLHFAGAVLTALFYARVWAVGAFAAFFAVFCLLPAALELLTLFFVARVSAYSY